MDYPRKIILYKITNKIEGTELSLNLAFLNAQTKDDEPPWTLAPAINIGQLWP